MKRLLLAILATLLLATNAFATSYYACNSAQVINGDSTWCTAATRGDACTKASGDYTAYGTLTSADTLFANGCTVSIPEQFIGTFAKISNKTDGTATDGGQFTVVTTGWTHNNTSLTADLETGETTGAALAISGAGNQNPIFTLTTVSAGIVAGSAAGMNGIYDNHTVGKVVVNATQGGLNGGSNATARGYACSGCTVDITGNVTAVTGEGLLTSTAAIVDLTGSCIGSTTTFAPGCNSQATTTPLIVRGNIQSGTKGTGVNGWHQWIPAAVTNYISAKTTGDAVLEARSPVATDVKSGVKYGTATGTLSSGGAYAY